jgi:hypothetical protein
MDQYPDFDELQYQALYSDLTNLDSNELKQHWLDIGSKEGRHYTIYQAYLDFYEPHYRALYDDLKDLSNKELELHWLQIGRKEGRHYTIYHAYPDFNEQIYQALYEDLSRLSGKELQLHWLAKGRQENRTYDFYKMYPDVNELAYRDMYSELKDASSTQVKIHWLHIGKNLQFREDHYQALYSDLKDYTDEQLRNHWINIGNIEGRKCNLYQITPQFNEEHYQLLYDELKGLSSKEVQLNWLNVGRNKRRHFTIYQAYPTFKPEIYRALYDDLKNLNDNELEIHWLRVGKVKRRKYTVLQYYPDFKENMYQALYDDLTGLSSREVQLHWLNVGRKEGRTYHFQKMYPHFNELEYREKYNLEELSLEEIQHHWLKVGIKKDINYFNLFYPKFDEEMYCALHNLKDLTLLEVQLDFLKTERTYTFHINFDEEMYRARYGLNDISSRDVQLDWLRTGRSDGCDKDFDEEMYRARYELNDMSVREVQLDWLRTGRSDGCDTDFDEEIYRLLHKDVQHMSSREVQLDWLRSGRSDGCDIDFDEEMYRALYDLHEISSRNVLIDFLKTKRSDKFVSDDNLSGKFVSDDNLSGKFVSDDNLSGKFTLEFDEEMYRKLYELDNVDVREVQLDWLRTTRTDRFECLYPDFKEDHYRELYSDLQNMTSDELRENWLSVGRKTGRHSNIYSAFPYFNEIEYQALYYDDLQNMTSEQLQLNWLKIGRVKRKKCSIIHANPNFRENHYRAFYDDLKDMNSLELRLHWIKIGRLKHRHTNIYEVFPDFNPKIYIELYDDLKDFSIEQAEIHWLKVGRIKRRKYKTELVYPDFNENIYKTICDEVKDFDSVDTQIHWLKLDKKNRNKFLFNNLYPDFKSEIYKIINPELSDMTDLELKIHWLDIGRYTGLKYSVCHNYPNFDSRTYRRLNEKLENLTDIELEIHWLTIGSKNGLHYSLYEVYPEFNINKYRKLVWNSSIMTDIDLEIHWLDIGRYSDLYYRIYDKSIETEFVNSNKNKILVVIQNSSKKGINKHTYIIKKNLDTHIMTLDNTSKKYIRFNMNYKLYDYVLWQNTHIDLPLKQNCQKYIYIVHSTCESWTHEEIETAKKNNSLIDLYIYVNETIKKSFENTIIIPKSGIVIENQLERIENNSQEIAKLYVSCGSYCESKNHYFLIDEFSKLDNTNTLEIYGDIIDRDYFNGLKQYIDDKKLTNIKLLEYNKNYFNRLKEAEYFCLFSKNERDSYSILEAMALQKKIVCSEECLSIKQLRYYQKRFSSFLINVSNDSYISPDYIFIDKMKHAIIYSKDTKRYIDNIIVTENTDNDIIFKEIKYGLKHLKLSKGLSFLLRIKNEELYLLNNLFQIYLFADEIIIVDNGSDDKTLDIIDYFNTFYKKVYVYYYNININNVTQNENNYKKQIGTFYNWALSKVTKYNVIKWDGDFEIIKEALFDMIENYQLRDREDQFALWFSGLTKFYKKYINISSYYDEYRCFSKLNGFMWADTNKCETAGNYVKEQNTKRYVYGYTNIDNPCWLNESAKRFDYTRKPVFIENKNYNDYKDLIIDNRCLNDNNILNLLKQEVLNHSISSEIIFIFKDSIKTGINIDDYLLYFGKDVRYILLNPNNDVDNIKYYSLDSFMNRLEMFRYDKLYICTYYHIDIEKLNKNNNVKVIGLLKSEINKEFIKNSSDYYKIIATNDYIYQKYKKLNIENVVLLSNNLELVNITSHSKIFNKKLIKALFFLRTPNDKNTIMLIDAIERLIADNVPIYLDVYSDIHPSELKYKLKYKNNIIFKKIPNNKQIYLQYDICLVPYLLNLYNDILDPINYEIPVICSKNLENDEIIQNKLPMFEFCDTDIGIEDFNIHEQNVEEIKRKTNILIQNFRFYKEKTIKLKQKIGVQFFNIKQYMIDLNNLLSENIKIIDYPVS